MTRKTMSTLRQRRNRLAGNLPPIELTLRGSLYKRFIRCGKSLCRCKLPGARGHGPYHYLTVNRGAGNTISLKIPEQMVEEVAEWVRNYKELHRKLEEISRINLELIAENKKLEKTKRREK
jgi:hypothetical protein